MRLGGECSSALRGSALPHRTHRDQWKNATEADHEWMVVDIDNWLEGNSFYVVEEAESGKHGQVSEVDDESRK